MTSLFLARSRRAIRLGNELGRGGEGIVFEIADSRADVAKVYLTRPDETRVQKLRALANAGTPSLMSIAAWPTDLLTDANGTVRGFMMPRVDSRRDIHELYSPKSRLEAFPEADFRFLAHVGSNIARAFAAVHEHGHILGDVNHGNVLVGPDGTVRLIDCDSFQVRSGSSVFTCDVGVGLFTAPELHGMSFRGLTRTTNHDAFGLAILLFHLLYLGRHPFAGRYSGSGEMTVERAIRERRFAYGQDRSRRQMEQPPGTLALEALSQNVARLFVSSFGQEVGAARPGPRAWIEELQGLLAGLRVCQRASWHHYPAAVPECPWCQVEIQTGVRLFGRHAPVEAPIEGVDVGTAWMDMAAALDPGPDPALPSERRWHPPPGIQLPSVWPNLSRKILGVGLVCAGVGACAVGGGGLLVTIVSWVLAAAVWPRPPVEKVAAADRALSAARAEWESALADWRHQASRTAVADRAKIMETARAELMDLGNERDRRLAKLEAEKQQTAKRRYLDRFRIDRAGIRGIAQGRTAMLASYGIETAADVSRLAILRIPGFGEGLTGDLVSWRNGHERNFRFDPRQPVDPRDLAALESELLSRRRDLTNALRLGPAALKRISQDVGPSRLRLMPILERAWTAFRIAEAERKAL